jgi:hypothetical protein
MGVVLALTLWLGTQSTHAAFTFVIPSGTNNTAGNPVDATAVFTVSPGEVTVQITNNFANITGLADNQTINGVEFTLNTPVSSSTGMVTASPGTFINISGTGAVTSASGVPWGYSESGSSVEISSLLASNMGGAPTIIGTASNYAAANASIKNGSHNPFLQGSATFTIPVANLPANATITSMQFEFGTATGDNVPGVMQAVPEPASLVMASTSAVIGLGLAWRLRNRSRNSVNTDRASDR